MVGGERPARAFVFTAAPQFDSTAEGKGLPRFPKGAAVTVVTSAGQRPVAPALYASADPAVSFDGARILFAGKATVHAPWEIWEVAATGGTPRVVIHCQTDCTHPLYLPDGRIACTRASATGSDLEVDGRATHVCAGTAHCAGRFARRPHSLRARRRTLHRLPGRYGRGIAALRSWSAAFRCATDCVRRRGVRCRRPAGAIHFGAGDADRRGTTAGRIARTSRGVVGRPVDRRAA